MYTLFLSTVYFACVASTTLPSGRVMSRTPDRLSSVDRSISTVPFVQKSGVRVFSATGAVCSNMKPAKMASDTFPALSSAFA